MIMYNFVILYLSFFLFSVCVLQTHFGCSVGVAGILDFAANEQALSAKHRSHRHHAHDTEMTEAEPSRTPEDSVCSVEGPTETGGEISTFTTSKATSGIYN